MYNKEKAKENYIKNRDKLNERAKQYYHDNKEARQKYNNEYWTEHKHKYLEQRRYNYNERRQVRIQTSNNKRLKNNFFSLETMIFGFLMVKLVMCFVEIQKLCIINLDLFISF